ncbi:MAG: hypothetical protein IRZ33_08160 [Alicyclobacillaceae bacterium]|nr:hypothetical protein [Alicyclobacillaceae bacterium]
MNPFLPDWMFAAFAIGGWELFDLIARRWHWPWAHRAGAAIAAASCLVLCVRYVVRWIRRWRHPESPDPDEWRHY